MALKKNEYYVVCWADFDDPNESGPVNCGKWFKDRREAEFTRKAWEQDSINTEFQGMYVVVKYQLPEGTTTDDIMDFIYASGFWEDDDDDWFDE